MRVLICDTQTGRFLAEADGWTDDREQALDFQHCERAIELARERGFSLVEIVLDFGESRYDIRLPFHRVSEGFTPPDLPPPAERPGTDT